MNRDPRIIATIVKARRILTKLAKMETGTKKKRKNSMTKQVDSEALVTKKALTNGQSKKPIKVTRENKGKKRPRLIIMTIFEATTLVGVDLVNFFSWADLPFFS